MIDLDRIKEKIMVEFTEDKSTHIYDLKKEITSFKQTLCQNALKLIFSKKEYNEATYCMYYTLTQKDKIIEIITFPITEFDHEDFPSLKNLDYVRTPFTTIVDWRHYLISVKEYDKFEYEQIEMMGILTHE